MTARCHDYRQISEGEHTARWDHCDYQVSAACYPHTAISIATLLQRCFTISKLETLSIGLGYPWRLYHLWWKRSTKPFVGKFHTNLNPGCWLQCVLVRTYVCYLERSTHVTALAASCLYCCEVCTCFCVAVTAEDVNLGNWQGQICDRNISQFSLANTFTAPQFLKNRLPLFRTATMSLSYVGIRTYLCACIRLIGCLLKADIATYLACVMRPFRIWGISWSISVNAVLIVGMPLGLVVAMDALM